MRRSQWRPPHRSSANSRREADVSHFERAPQLPLFSGVVCLVLAGSPPLFRTLDGHPTDSRSVDWRTRCRSHVCLFVSQALDRKEIGAASGVGCRGLRGTIGSTTWPYHSPVRLDVASLSRSVLTRRSTKDLLDGELIRACLEHNRHF